MRLRNGAGVVVSIVKAPASGLAMAAAAMASLLMGAGIVATRFVIDQTEPVSLAFFRYLIGFLCIVPLVIASARVKFDRGDVVPIGLLGVIQFAVVVVLLNFALQYIPAARAALIFATMPLLTMFLSAALGRERLTIPKTAGVILTIVGVGFVLGERAALENETTAGWMGELAAFASALSGALFNVLARRYLAKYPTLHVSAIAMFAAIVVLGAVAIARGSIDGIPHFTPPGWLAVLFIGLSSGLGFYLWMWALGRISPTRVTVFLALSPITATILGAALLGESLSLLMWTGMICAGLGLWLAQRGAGSKKTFLDACAELIGPENVSRPDESMTRAAARDVGEMAARTIAGVLRPTTREQVAGIVGLCRTSDEKVSLYPISTGFNWGLGSKLPVTQNAVVVDLSRLDRILELDLRNGVAVIEPGVTQAALAAALRGSEFLLNLTTSSPDTSILGNALERGVGLYRQRTADLIGLDVVLGTGETMQVGATRQAEADAVWQDAPGPGLLSIFTQSNFGVAVAGTIALIRRAEVIDVVKFAFTKERAPQAIVVLRNLMELGAIKPVLKIYSATGSGIYGGNNSGQVFTCYARVEGFRGAVEAAHGRIRAGCEASGAFALVQKIDTDSAGSVMERALVAGFSGDLAHHDGMFNAALGVCARDVDTESEKGWLFCLPIVSFSPDAILGIHSILDQVVAGTGVEGHASVNVLSSSVASVVIALRFPRTPEVTPVAHRCLDRLHEAYAGQAIFPYRLDVDRMSLLGGTIGSDANAAVLRRIKQVLDPSVCIAPGRYI